MSGGGFSRRKVLTVAVCGGSATLAGCGGGGGSEPDPKLKNAFFVVEEPSFDKETTDIRFALKFDRDATGVNIEDSLNVQGEGEVVRDSSVSLQWFENYISDGEEFDEAISDTRLENQSWIENIQEDATVDLDNSAHGRIEDAVSLPFTPYSGEKCTVPEISYDGSDSQVKDNVKTRLQMHDGSVWDYPPKTPTYNYSLDNNDVNSQYSISPESMEVEELGIDFEGGVPRAPSDKNLLVPEMQHRALPTIGTLQNLAHQRAALLDNAGRVIATDLMGEEDGLITESFQSTIEDRVWDTARPFVQAGVPVPTQADDALFSLGVKFVPLVGAATVGPAGFAAGMLVSGVIQVGNTIDSINDFANKYDSDFTSNEEFGWDTIFGSMEESMWEGGARGWGEVIYLGTDGYISIYDSIALSEFQRQIGTEALATQDSFNSSISDYKTALDELKGNVQDYRTKLDNDLLKRAGDRAKIENYYQEYFVLVEDIIETERSLLDGLPERIASFGFIERFDSESLENTTEPSWNVTTFESEFSAEINNDEDKLHIEADSGEGVVETVNGYDLSDRSWVLSGRFEVRHLSDQSDHSIVIRNNSNTELKLSLVFSSEHGGSIPQLILSGDSIETESRTDFDLQTGTYSFNIEFDGDDSITATVRPTSESEVRPTSESGEPIVLNGRGTFDANADRIQYYMATPSGKISVAHSRLVLSNQS